MEIYDKTITFSEVPVEICLTFFVSGCKLGCDGCSWQNTELTQYELTPINYAELLEKYKGKATCVCFLGGEWNVELVNYLRLAHKFGYTTCLYTGLSMTEFIGKETVAGETGFDETINNKTIGCDANASHTSASETMSYRREIYEELDYAKFGRWKQELGGLDSPTTNQTLLNIKQKHVLMGRGNK